MRLYVILRPISSVSIFDLIDRFLGGKFETIFFYIGNDKFLVKIGGGDCHRWGNDPEIRGTSRTVGLVEELPQRVHPEGRGRTFQ